MSSNLDYMPILKDMLSVLPDTLDKREGSIIYNALAPTALLITQQNYMVSYLINLLFADTADGIWLDRVVNDFGLDREQATKAIRQINFTDSEGKAVDIPLGSRFAIRDITLKTTERMEEGKYKAECEQVGDIGNLYSGIVLPVDNINGLGAAELLVEPLIPARDTETDESLRERFYLATRRTAFGGNIADYENKALEIEGVGSVKVFTAVTQGAGNVGLVIGDEQGNRATQELIDVVQALMGVDGDGIAPIGHTVTVSTATDLVVNVEVPIRVKTGASFALLQPIVTQVVTDYIENIKFQDETVFLAKLIAEVLNCNENIVDVGAVTLNDTAGNLSLTKTFENYQVPVVGTVTVSEVSHVL